MLDLDPVDVFAIFGSFNEASGDTLEHGGVEVRICGEGGGDGVGGERYNWEQRGVIWGCWRMACWQFIGDVNGYI